MKNEKFAKCFINLKWHHTVLNKTGRLVSNASTMMTFRQNDIKDGYHVCKVENECKYLIYYTLTLVSDRQSHQNGHLNMNQCKTVSYDKY